MVKNLKKIIAKVVLITLLLPNISIKADNITNESENLQNTNVQEIYTDENKEIDENHSTDNAKELEVIENSNLEDSKSDNEYENINKDDNKANLNENNIEEDKLDDINEELVNSEYEVEIININQNINTISAFSAISEDYTSYVNERVEFELKSDEMQTYSKLKLKTDSKYEIAISHENGRYTYLDNAETIDEALNKIYEIPSVCNSESTLPVIINSDGQIVYSTYSMARIYKHIDGKPYPYFDKNTKIYSDKDLSREFTYINQGYVDDAPVLEFNGSSSAKILVSGYEGWINMNTKDKEYDMIVVPVNQVKNPSYYNVKNGMLYHFISSNLTSGTSGTSIAIGKAPDYLKQGKYYFSYDGVYFYDGSNITVGLTNLISDYQSGTRDMAINKDTPYYSYFKSLPFRSKTNYTASDLNRFIEANTKQESKLRGSGQAFIDAQNSYGVNALLALGIAINESGWGMSSIAIEKNNIFGLNAVDSNPGMAADTFSSVAVCITDFTKNWISRGYADPADWRYFGGFLGDKKMGANIKYASDPFWGEKAAAHALAVDYYLSGNDIDNLRDYNGFKLIMFNGSNQVIGTKGELLYEIHPIVSGWGGYPGTMAVLSDDVEKYIDGEYWVEIYPERGTPINNGGESNKFDGNYDWNKKARIKAKNIIFINADSYSDWKLHWAYKEIRYAMNNRWVNTTNKFRPDDAITRAEFVKIVNKAFGFTVKNTSSSFNDVKPNDWFYNEVLIALKYGYIDSKNTNFRPNDPITREEVAAIITTIKKNKDSNLDKIKKYDDYGLISEWAKSSVEGAVEAKYMGQTSTNKFRPKDNITRAEAVVTLFRIVQ